MIDVRRFPSAAVTWFAVGCLWLFQWLPLAWQAVVGRALGRVLHAASARRRHVAHRNLSLCFPAMPEVQRNRLVRANFEWAGRSMLERGLLWFASAERLKRLVHVEGDVGFAARTGQPVMWLVPHFVGLELAGTASQLFQSRDVVSMYQPQTNPVVDKVLREGRARFGRGALFSRNDRVTALVRAIRGGMAFLNLPDMDFGARDAAFVPFFGVPAATLLAPSRMARSLGMAVQPVVTEILPGGQGYLVRFLPPWTDFPTDDAEADTLRMNRWIETEILRNPTQYLWLHKRFKTRPPGEPPLY